MLRFALPAFLAVIFSSCLSDPDCVITATNDVKISFLKVTPDSVRTEVRDTLILDSIRISGTDSVFYVADTVSSVVLPVNVGAYETTFFFYYESQQDSIKMSYTRNTRVISPACGAFNYFQDLSLLLSTFSEVKVTEAELSTSVSNNVKIKR
ncbi:MAG: hypothetical protein JNN04_12545 [Cyclobacteriaceae bacterium]|nr:hypothetical protein [Cyclobacteriaceae bacterium]